MVVRIGVIGIGSMGTGHANYLLNGEIKNAELTCVCDIEQNKVNTFCKNHPEIKGYLNYEDLIGSGEADAVIIAVPHYLHPIIATYALRHNMHVIVEKPVGIYAENVAEMNKAAEESGKVFSSMFCVRTDPYFCKIKELVQSGELGGIKRVNWIATDWYRPQAYHNSSAWRSSWKGEGGGVLVNQSPHNLDLIQWIFGLPESVTATAEFGKYYDIEVDDEATAILKYPTFSCVYIASTGETPGTNRLEISADMGKLVLEGGQIRFFRNVQSEREYNRNNKDVMDKPEFWECTIPPLKGQMKHQNITQNFVNAILFGEPLIAPGADGIHEVELANAIYVSAWTEQKVTLPLDPARFSELLNEKIKASKKG